MKADGEKPLSIKHRDLLLEHGCGADGKLIQWQC